MEKKPNMEFLPLNHQHGNKKIKRMETKQEEKNYQRKTIIKQRHIQKLLNLFTTTLRGNALLDS